MQSPLFCNTPIAVRLWYCGTRYLNDAALENVSDIYYVHLGIPAIGKPAATRTRQSGDSILFVIIAI